MAAKSMTLDEARIALDLYAQTGMVTKAAKLAGISPETMRSRIRRARELIANIGEAPPADQRPELTDSRSESSLSCEITKVSKKPVQSLEEMILVCDVDTNEWDVERYVVNKWSVAMKVGPKENKVSKVEDLYQIKVWLKRKTVQDKTMAALRIELAKDIRDALKDTPRAPSILKNIVKTGWLFQFAPVDLHVGKYAWDEEVVTNYDSDIAVGLGSDSLEFLLNRAMKLADGKLERILFLVGNDVSHVDQKKGQTTAGTPMDVDTRYIRVYRKIVAMHRWATDMLRGVAPVDIKVVSGNHDELTAFHLGEILATRYEKDKFVTVDNSPRVRKYYEFGVNMWGFTHGDSERVAELPLTMAREQPDMWARSKSREWHIGHLHKSEAWETRNVRGRSGAIEQSLYSDKGVRIRRLTSLSAHDAWHLRHAYMDRRASEGFVFHKAAGFTGHLNYNIDHFSGKPMLPGDGKK